MARKDRSATIAGLVVAGLFLALIVGIVVWWRPRYGDGSVVGLAAAGEHVVLFEHLSGGARADASDRLVVVNPTTGDVGFIRVLENRSTFLGVHGAEAWVLTPSASLASYRVPELTPGRSAATGLAPCLDEATGAVRFTAADGRYLSLPLDTLQPTPVDSATCAPAPTVEGPAVGTEPVDGAATVRLVLPGGARSAKGFLSPSIVGGRPGFFLVQHRAVANDSGVSLAQIDGDGATRWDTALPGSGVGSHVDVGAHVSVFNVTGTAVAVDVTTGAVLWSR